MESQFGLSTDQKWVSIAPCFFDFLKISFNPGYNAAPWNTFERTLTGKEDGQYMVNTDFPLIFFHFSNFDHSDPQYLNKRASCEKGKQYELLDELGRDYSNKLKYYEQTVRRPPYSFDYMSDGSYISPTLRRAYVSIKNKLRVDVDPFDSGGVIGAFAKKNNLLIKNRDYKYKYPTLSEAKSNSRTFDFVYLIMRVILRIFGPNKFYDLSKLMVYLSLYRKEHKYWRL
jgi:hypothetical protein